jgi:hypothetical protein
MATGNRRRDEEVVRLGTMVRAVVACALIAGLGIGYVRQSAQQLELGQQIAGLEQRRERLEQTLAMQKLTLSTLTSRPELLAKVQRFKLNLTNAAPAQRLYVTVPGGAGASNPPVSRPAGRLQTGALPALAVRR